MSQRICSRAFLVLGSLVCLVFATFVALEPASAATDVDDDEPPWVMSLGPVDPEPQHGLWVDGASTGSLWVSVQATFVRTDDGRRDFAAMALLGVPLERMDRARERRLAKVTERAGETIPAAALQEVVPETSEPKVLVSPNMAKAAIAAALEKAKQRDATGRIDRLAARARVSGLLPELRLRVTRQLDDAQVLSPTEYDPDRVTATVKASLWLEARATFKLDKLVFADEEVALERLREDRLEAGKKLTERVLETLFSWQRAIAVRDDSAREPEERMKAAFAVVEAEVMLDVMTGGWLSRWKAAHDASL